MNSTRFSIRLWLCAGLLIFSLPPLLAAPKAAAPVTLATLLARHKRAITVSGSAPAQKMATETVYAINASGLSGSLTEWDAPPKRSRVEMALGPLRQIEADNGTIAWQQDATGNVRIVRGAELVASRAATSFSIEGYDPLKKSQRGAVTLRPKRDPATGDYILDVAPKGGAKQVVYISPKTYLVTKMIAVKGGISGTIKILSYGIFNGQRIPSHLQIQYAGLPLAVSATLVRAQLIAHADPSLFAAPASTADCDFLGPSDPVSATIPFSNAHDEIILPVEINGQSLHFILDSGAGASFITADAAKQLGLTSAAALFAFGYGGTSATGLASHATVELAGKVRLKNQNLYVISDPNVTEMLSAWGVDGALGYDLLARLTATIDYAGNTLTLIKPTSYTAPAKDVADIPLNLEMHVPRVAANIDGKAVGEFMLDTGDSGGVHLYDRYAKANGLLPNRRDSKTQLKTGAGIGGLITEDISPGHTLKLGGKVVRNIAVATTTDPGISRISGDAGGIGNQALSRFLVTFDYAHARVLLQDPGAQSGQPSYITTPQVSFAASRNTGKNAAMTTAEFLARHLKAIGGRKAVMAIHSTKITQTVETGGLKGTETGIYKSPDKVLDLLKLGITNTAQGYDGKTAWLRETNGSVRMLGDDELRDLRLQLYINTNSYVLPEEGIPGTTTLRPKREPGTGDYILDVKPKDGKPGVLYVDPKSFLIVKEEEYDDNILETTTFSHYKAVDGVQFPFALRTTNGNARYDQVFHVTEVKNNVAAPDSLFAPPATSDRNAAFTKPGATTASTAFTLDDGEISIPAQINGQPFRLYLDSGASGLALSQNVADSLHLKQNGTLEARGYGGSTDLHPVIVDTLEIPGAVRLSNVAAVSIALPPGIGQSADGPIAGFIGYDLLSRYVTKIDYAARRITFTDPAAFQPTPADGKPLSLNLDNDLPSVTAQFDDLPAAQFLLDTGDVSALRLYGPYVTQNGLREKYPKEIPSVGGGIGGESKSQLAKTDKFTIAGVTLHGIPTEFSLDSKGGASQLLAGSLGSGLLSRFIVTFDYPHGRVFFAPTPEASKPYDTREFGLTITSVKDDKDRPHIVIIDLDADSPAARAGLLLYDQILEIDGQPVKTMSLAEVRKILSPAGGADTHTLALYSPKGERRTIKVTLYDPLAAAEDTK